MYYQFYCRKSKKDKHGEAPIELSVDDFLDRSLNASHITDGINDALSYGESGYSWFLR